MRELEEARTKATDHDQLSAAVAAIKAKAYGSSKPVAVIVSSTGGSDSLNCCNIHVTRH